MLAKGLPDDSIYNNRRPRQLNRIPSNERIQDVSPVGYDFQDQV